MQPAPRPRGADRREFLTGAVLLALALGMPVEALARTATPPDSRHLALLREVSQLVIPRSDTPGAGDIGVAAFVMLALAHGLLGTGDGKLDYIAWLEGELNHRAGGNFLAAPAMRRAQALGLLDADAFPAGPPPATPSPWQAIKGLILTGYYTSEVGGSQELRYELTPARFDPDLPLHPADRAWSSDWTAVDFG